MSIRFVVVVGVCFVDFGFGSLVASSELHVSGLPVNQMGLGCREQMHFLPRNDTVFFFQILQDSCRIRYFKGKVAF